MTLIRLSKIAMMGVLCTSSFVFAQTSLVQKCVDMIETPSATDKGTAKYLECKTLESLSKGRSLDVISREDKKSSVTTSMNQKVQCREKASYTFDYESCEHAINVYNYVLLAETAMNLQQQTRTEFNNKKLQAHAQESASRGDLQTGALDVNEKAQRFSAELYKERVAAFSLAVTALVTAAEKISGESSVKKHCEKDTTGELPPAECMKNFAKHKTDILANAQAKHVLRLEAARYTAEVLRSVAEMNRSLANADKTKEIKNKFDDISDNQNNLQDCFFYPTAAHCVQNRDRTVIDPVAGGGVNFGGEGANNAFDMSSGINDSLDEPEDSNYNNQDVARMGSPFSDEARAAQGILDPAAAANVQSDGGGVNGGGGGGGSGGGGLGGGGGAPAEEDDQLAKTSITGGDVESEEGSAKGKGFSALSKGKGAAENPFASLFDGKGTGGGIEEDRSIASGDISGQASGLFQKISKRYGQVQADKRVESNNLE